MAQKTTELVFVPLPIMSHLVGFVKLAKLLTDRDQRLSVTILVLQAAADTKTDSYTKNSAHPRLRFVHIVPQNGLNVLELTKTAKNFVLESIEVQKNPARDAVAEIGKDPTRNLAAFVIDVLCSPMMDVADEFGVPSYVCYTFSAASVGLSMHFQRLAQDLGQEQVAKIQGSDAEFSVSAYVNPVPASILPSGYFENECAFLTLLRRVRESKGILINTFVELEPHAVKSLLNDEGVPKIYPVGPIIQEASGELGHQETNKSDDEKEILQWLDQQPDSSVVYLCFGSMGCFQGEQLKEIATALEKSGHRFLWSLRKPKHRASHELAEEQADPTEVLPEGFVRRTAASGRVIGWAPQIAVLSHPSVGGFVSHCGWNSILESAWCGVPMAAWPVFAEQQSNAFQLVKEIEIAVEIKMDYGTGRDVVVRAEKIREAIMELMRPESKVRANAKAIKDKSRTALGDHGSSNSFLGLLVKDIIDNVPRDAASY